MKANPVFQRTARKLLLLTIIFESAQSKILLKNTPSTKLPNAKETQDTMRVGSESRKLLVNLWSQDPQSKPGKLPHQKIDFFGTVPDHYGNSFDTFYRKKMTK